MKAKTRRRTPERPAPAARGPRRKAPPLLLRGIAALLLLAAVVVLAWHPWRARPPVDPLAGVAPGELARTADELERRGHYLEAVAPILHLLRSGPPRYSHASRASTTLNNAAIEVREKDGYVMPATRSSIERIALLRESLEWSKRAEELAPGPEYRTAEIGSRAEQLSSWGFHREAFTEFVRASQLSPLDAQFLAEARWEEVMLADPTTVLSGRPAPGSAPVVADSSARPVTPAHER